MLSNPFLDFAGGTCTPEHPIYVHGRGFVRAGYLRIGDRVATADGQCDAVVSVAKHTGVAIVYNFEVAHDHLLCRSGLHGLWVHNGPCNTDLVSDILKGKKGSIRNAPLDPGSPSWEDILTKTWKEIEDGAKANRPGYKTIRKLLTDGRFNK